MMNYEKPVVELVSFQTEATMASWDIRLDIEGRDDGLLASYGLSLTHEIAI